MIRLSVAAFVLVGLAGAAFAQPGGHGQGQGFGPGGRADAARERVARVDAMFRLLDADGDGRITAAEVAAARAARFAAADSDGDGRLDPAEFEAMRRAMRAERAFARHDGDGDGFLTEAELAARSGRMEAGLGPDGVLTRDEALAGGRGKGRMWHD